MQQKSLVLDTNILLRAIFGVRVIALLETYQDSIAFYTPALCFSEAEAHLPAIASRRGADTARGFRYLARLAELVETIDSSLYEAHEATARQRMASRDLADWPIAATALLLDCPIWTEDQDFFGAGIATWTTANVELYLRDA